MTIKFYLDKPKAENETAIYLFLRFYKATLKFNTGKRIHPKYWNQDNPNVHFRKFSGSQEMNIWLDNLRTEINRIYYSVGPGNWNVDELREKVNQLVHNEAPKDTQQEFWTALTEFIESKTNNGELAISTVKRYRTLRSHLEAFSNLHKVSLKFERINRRFFEDFAAFLRNHLAHTNNTVNKYLKTLKTFINWAIDHEYTSADSVSLKYKIKDNDSEIIVLTWEELMSLYYLELPPESALARVRDVFCFGCFTGQRFSDISNLKHGDIVKRHSENGITTYWILHQIKVKDTVKNEIPLNDFALSILDRYNENNKPLPVISNQKTNEHLKNLGKQAGIDEEITIIKYRGNERIEIRQPKYMFMATHTARRTFVTLSLERGMRQEMVMAISGHEDYKTMKRYVAITNKMKGNEMRTVWSASKEPAIRKNTM